MGVRVALAVQQIPPGSLRAGDVAGVAQSPGRRVGRDQMSNCVSCYWTSKIMARTDLSAESTPR
jgi:hypothetical protein